MALLLSQPQWKPPEVVVVKKEEVHMNNREHIMYGFKGSHGHMSLCCLAGWLGGLASVLGWASLALCIDMKMTKQ